MLTEKDLANLKPHEKDQSIAYALLDSLYLFTHFLGYVDVNPRTHGETIACLESMHPRKLLTIPRGAFKSSIASISYPIWKILRDPNERILIDSEVYGNAVLYLRVIKEHFKSEDFMRVFGDLEGPVWQEGSIVVASRTKKYKEPTITCGGVATTRVGMHYSTIIGDDYNSRENSKTKELAQGVIDHFRYNLNILEPDGEYVIIGTRYSEDDLLGFILREVLGKKRLSEGKLDYGLIEKED